MRTIIEDHGLPLMQVGRVSRDEDLAEWPTVSTADFRATLGLLLFVAIVFAMCLVIPPVR